MHSEQSSDSVLDFVLLSQSQSIERITALSDTSDSTPEPTSTDGYEALKEEEKTAEEGHFTDVRDRKFRLVDELPGIIMLDLGLAADPSATTNEQAKATRQFLHAVIHPDDVVAFEHFLRTAKPVIDMEELGKIMENLLTEISGRPTK